MFKVSVVVPCRNEVKYIATCVRSLYASTYPELEVIVVDGMSEDGTREVLKELQQEFPTLKVVDNPQKLTPFAFNLGIRAAEGYYIQIVGSRNVLATDYITLLVSALESRPDVACVGGDYQHTFDTPNGKFISFAMESRLGVGGSNYRTKKEDCYVDTVGVPLYRKSIFDEIGYFDERLTRNQDDELNFRLTEKGYKIFFCEAAKVKYFVRGSFSRLFKQYRQYGYFKVFVNRMHRRITTKRQLVPAAFVLFLVLGGILGIYSPVFFSVYTLILSVYFVLGLATAVTRTKRMPGPLLVLWSIFILHLAYGMGYLQGIWDFLIFRRSPALSMQNQST